MWGQGPKGMCTPVLWRLVAPCLTQWFWSHSGRSITMWLIVVYLSKLEHIGTILQWIIILHWFQCSCFLGVVEAEYLLEQLKSWNYFAWGTHDKPVLQLQHEVQFILGGYAQEGALFIDGTAQESHESHDWGLWLFVHSSFQRSWIKSVYCILYKHLFAECRIVSRCYIEKSNETSPITR
jgi:hypothetical protein